MAYKILSNSQQEDAFSETEKLSLSGGRDDKLGSTNSSVTSQLYIKASSSARTQPSSGSLDKEVVLRRIRHHKCLKKGLKLELCTTDRVGLLSDVSRIFHENSLIVTRAEVTTRGGKAVDTFYVRGASGYPVNTKTIDSIRKAITVKGNTEDLYQTT